MPAEIRAVIDVGTNSVKLLVGEVNAGHVSPLHETSHQTRLGQGFYESHILQPGPIQDTATTVADFARSARKWNPARIQVIATSAARDASNAAELLRSIKAASGLDAVILSGETEAALAYRGVLTSGSISGGPLLVMDVGGGSTELIVGNGHAATFARSFALGSVRLLERVAPHDPPSARDLDRCQTEVRKRIEQEIRPALAGHLEPPLQFVGTGGTSTILARLRLEANTFDRDAIERTAISMEQISAEQERLWALPLSERRKLPGLPANRADVILPGIVIISEIMRAFAFAELRVSTRGLRVAALLADNLTSASA